MAKQYAVYKGEELLAMGTAKECTDELKVITDYIRRLTTPTAKYRLSKRRHLEKCTVGISLSMKFKEFKVFIASFFYNLNGLSQNTNQ